MIAVTGAAGVLGQAVIRHLVEAGLEVAAIDLAPHIKPAGQRLTLTNVDLADPMAAKTAIDRIGETPSAITGLANIAGGFRWETLDSGSTEVWELMHRMNFMTALNCMKAALLHLRRTHGAVVNVGAMAAYRSAAGMGAYAASKSAVARLTESVACEEIDSGVRVNAVLPSMIDTPQNRLSLPDADFSRWVTPDDLARVVLFLLSNAAAAVTGASVPVNGRVI